MVELNPNDDPPKPYQGDIQSDNYSLRSFRCINSETRIYEPVKLTPWVRTNILHNIVYGNAPFAIAVPIIMLMARPRMRLSACLAGNMLIQVSRMVKGKTGVCGAIRARGYGQGLYRARCFIFLWQGALGQCIVLSLPLRQQKDEVADPGNHIS
ncbi:hypothetical protein GGR57DRAFT_207713 [Xylariaceae sp. FL1272]|nr:hypothetical protein GGR57DRAFT_207713 [Xylariaceae sp. FL1272]